MSHVRGDTEHLKKKKKGDKNDVHRGRQRQ